MGLLCVSLGDNKVYVIPGVTNPVPVGTRVPFGAVIMVALGTSSTNKTVHFLASNVLKIQFFLFS